MRNYKRLFKFLKGKYHLLVTSIILIILIQVIEFISPLLVKVVLDDCIMGIEYDWVEVVENTDAVAYNGKYYKQVRSLNDQDVVLKDVDVIINKNGFFFIDNDIVKGQKKVINNDGLYTLEVKDDYDVTYKYKAYKLDKTEVLSFYKPITPTLFKYIILIFIKTIVTILLSFFNVFTINKTVNYIANEGRTRALKKAEYLPISYFEEEPAGKMATRITNDVDGMIMMYRQLMSLFLSVIMSFTLAYVGMFMLNYKLAFLTFIIYPFIFLWIRFFLKHLRKIAVKVNEARSMLTAKINEVINGINILQIFNFKTQTVSEFNQINEEYRVEQLKDVKLGTTLGWNLIHVIRAVVNTLIVVYFGWQSITVSGVLVTAGLIYAFTQYLGKIVDPLNIIFTQISIFQNSHVRVERIHKLIEGKTEDDTKYLIERAHGDILFDDIWFSYTGNEYVLKGVTFDIKAGQFIGLVGHTGSGKSSMMNLLLRFYDLTDPLSGKIYIDGVDITTHPKRTYRQNLGIVLQEPIMIRGTIADNIRFGKDDVSDEEIERVLKMMGGEKILSKFPLGIKQELSRNGVNMSAGEKQIISLARVIVHNPPILIMDEATSHIDTQTENIIKKSLDIACLGRTTIVIAHRLSTIFNADKIFVLDHGMKVEEGTHEELVKQNGVYANIYRSQVANIQNLKSISSK